MDRLHLHVPVPFNGSLNHCGAVTTSGSFHSAGALIWVGSLLQAGAIIGRGSLKFSSALLEAGSLHRPGTLVCFDSLVPSGVIRRYGSLVVHTTVHHRVVRSNHWILPRTVARLHLHVPAPFNGSLGQCGSLATFWLATIWLATIVWRGLFRWLASALRYRLCTWLTSDSW